MFDKEIDRPLGLSIPERKAGGSRLRRKTVLAFVAALGIVGISAAIALRDHEFRKPAVEIAAAPAATPEPAKSDAPAKLEPSPAATVAGKATVKSPSIIDLSQPDQTTTGVVIVGDPTEMRQDARMAHMPDKALVERTALGSLPMQASDGRRPFDVYARKWSGARGARVAIVIGGLGMSQTGTQEAIAKLQPEVTLAFAPQGNSLGRWMQAARREGHEIVMQVPLEPFDYPNINPGRNTLTVAASPAENIDHLKWTLGRTTNYTGVMNYMGARFTGDAAAMEPLMAELGRRGLLYLDDGTSARSVAPDLAEKNGVPFASGDTVIDDVRERGAVMAKLDQLERTARAKGFAVGTGSAFDVTVEAVRTWVAEAKKRGIEIVPVSAVAIDPKRS